MKYVIKLLEENRKVTVSENIIIFQNSSKEMYVEPRKMILKNDHIKLFVIAFSIWWFWSLLL